MGTKTLKGQVEYFLINHPNTRDSDLKLMLNIWYKFYPKYIMETPDGKFVNLKYIYELPTQDNIKRLRAKFNEDGKYLTDKPQIRKQRKQKEIEWLFDLGYVK